MESDGESGGKFENMGVLLMFCGILFGARGELREIHLRRRFHFFLYPIDIGHLVRRNIEIAQSERSAIGGLFFAWAYALSANAASYGKNLFRPPQLSTKFMKSSSAAFK